MAKQTLFGFSIEDDEGKLVITVNGALAEGLTKQLRDETNAGRGGQLLARLLPLGSFHKLLSFSATQEESSEETSLSLEQMLGQNIDQTFASFEQQIADLKSVLAETAGESAQQMSNMPKEA
jgi:hypothetical protein